MISRRRILLGSTALICPSVLLSQELRPVRLLLVRRIGLTPTNQCLAPCIRGSIFDMSGQAVQLDHTILPLLAAQKPVCDVIERPWKDNRPSVSAIPKGVYSARIRTDRTKTWMTTAERAWRIELDGTHPRTAIQFHFGKDVAWSEGCFIVGSLLQASDGPGITAGYCKVDDGEAAVAALRAAVHSGANDIKNIVVGIVDDNSLFPAIQLNEPC